MKYYRVELHSSDSGSVINFMYKKNAKVWLAKNGYDRVSGTSDFWRGMDNTKYAKGMFEELELEDALITTELI